MNSFADVQSALVELKDFLERDDVGELGTLSEWLQLEATLKECHKIATRYIPARSPSGSSTGTSFSTGAREMKHALKSTAKREIRVLVVDDDEIAARTISRQLSSVKLENEFVLSGKDALAKLYKEPQSFDLVLCDVNMPGLDGGAVLRKILADSQLRYIPIVMVSSDSDLEKARELVQAGAKDYIVKPVRQISLLSLSDKVKSWKQASSSLHLAAIYGMSSALLLHIKVYLRPKVGESETEKEVPSSFSELIEGDATIERTVVHAASGAMCDLLGVTEADVLSGSVDIFDYVPAEDKEVLLHQMKASIFNKSSEGSLQEHLVWRWVDIRGNSVPVVGRWVRLGEPGDCEILLESSSLLPSLLLKREKERREVAEREAKALMAQSNQLQQDLMMTRKTDLSMRNELNLLMCEMSEFSKMVTENPHVLTWRFHLPDGKIDFVSSKSCEAVLGYDAKELIGKSNQDTLVAEDVEKAQKALTAINVSVRIRRKSKTGDIVWLESRAYAWWNKEKTIVIVTEYDISKLILGPPTS